MVLEPWERASPHSCIHISTHDLPYLQLKFCWQITLDEYNGNDRQHWKIVPESGQCGDSSSPKEMAFTPAHRTRCPPLSLCRKDLVSQMHIYLSSDVHTISIIQSEVNIAGRDQINNVYDASELCNVLGMTNLLTCKAKTAPKSQSGCLLLTSKPPREDSCRLEKRELELGCYNLRHSRTGATGRRGHCGVLEIVRFGYSDNVDMTSHVSLTAGAGKTILA